MTKLEINNTTLEIAERGSGEPIVFVHGSSSDYRTWRAQLEYFSARWRAVAYSRRYHWPNDPIPGNADYSMLEHADDLESLLQSLDPRPAHVVGHSYGGFLALLLAMRAPDLVRSLVVTEPPVLTLWVSNNPGAGELLGLFLRRPRTAWAILDFWRRGIGPATRAARRGDMKRVAQVLGSAIFGEAHYARLPPERIAQSEANTFAQELLGSGFPALDDDAMSRMQVPTLIVGGQDSPAVFQRLLDRLEELLPRVERVRVPGVSHLVHEQDPQTYNRAVERFVDTHSAA